MKRRRLYVPNRESKTVSMLHGELSQLLGEYAGMRVVLRDPDGAEWTVKFHVERAEGKPAVCVLTGYRTTVED